MNDPGLDEGVKDLVDAQGEVSNTGGASRPKSQSSITGERFLSPNFLPRGSRNNSNTSNSSHGSKGSHKSQININPIRRSCFWEQFSQDSREGADEGVENARKGRGAMSENGSVNSRSPIREPQNAEMGGNGDEEKNVERLNEISKRGQEDEQMPGLYFLLSTAFPLMAATLGPVTNVMSICALVVPWRIYLPSDAEPENAFKIPDPGWCLAINAISLACGFTANIILLLNLSKRIQSTSLQPFTITLWYLASILLIALLAVYRRHLYHTSNEQYEWSQAFYYGVIAATLYFVIATLLVGNYLGVLSGKFAKQFTLTVAQRTLMLQTMSLMCWLCLGAGVFAKLEGWAYLDGIYFCDTTFLVVGLGDYALTTNAGRALFFPYAAVGIVMVGLIVSSIRGLVLERGKRKVKRRMLEKQRENFVDGGKKSTEANTESQRERFELMRKVQDKADERRKWISLAVSVTFFLVFWLLGAFVFMETEEDMHWNYFQSLYFCFTIILTIGYGDFHPQSSGGKPFFVIWSLLAVPMMTILVSNLGDTLIAMIKNLTLRLGEWTVLPGERHPEEQKQKSEKPKDRRKEDEEMDDRINNPEETEDKKALKEIGGRLIEDERKEEDLDNDSTNTLHHDLACAVQKLLPDLAGKGKKQYSYAEWSEYLRLIDTPDRILEEKSRPPAISDRKEENEERDWLGEESPLMSRQSETEWLLTKICSRLEECLREQKETSQREAKGNFKGGSALAGRSTRSNTRRRS